MNSFLTKVRAVLAAPGAAGPTATVPGSEVIKRAVSGTIDWNAMDPEGLTRVFTAAAAEGQRLYLAEVSFEDVLLELVREVAEALRTQVPDPDQRQRLQGQALNALLTTGGALLGYHDEALRWRRFLTEIDLLTQMASRERFLKELDAVLEYARTTHAPLSLVWVDVDDLRLINDLYGYSVGDAVLRGVADLMVAHMGAQAAVCGRLDGNAFGALFPDVEPVAVVDLVNGFRSEVRQHRFVLDDFPVTVSAGIVGYPTHGTAAADLVAVAEAAVTLAKRKGKDRMEILDPAGGRAEDTLIHEQSAAIREALQDPEGVVPFFQPIVAADTEQVVGYEVLARLRVGNRILPAAQFVEVAEDMDVIGTITTRAVEGALAKTRAAKSDRLLFVNYSMREVERPGSVAALKEVLERWVVRPEQVVVELTERQAIRDIGRVSDFARELQDIGVRLALDDFGSGFSSFLYLRQFDCYFAKIEGALIRDIIRSARTKLIVEHIARLLHSLAIETVAEWVESAEVASILRRFGVSHFQGYFFGAPRPEL